VGLVRPGNFAAKEERLHLGASLIRALSAAVALLSAGSPAVGQVLRGIVVDGSSGRPVEGAHVVALLDDARTAATGTTSVDGSFVFRLPDLGTYRLRVSRVGYSAMVTQPIAVDSTFVTSVQLGLLPLPVPLDTVTILAEHVVAEKQLPSLVRGAFYDRRPKGFGYFLTRPDIEKHDPTLMTQALRGLPGVDVACTGRRMPVTCDVFMPAATTMFFRGPCIPSVVLDGAVLRVGGVANPSATLDDLLNPFNIEAIEVYPNAAGIPVQWAGYLSPCGAIIAWSRR